MYSEAEVRAKMDTLEWEIAKACINGVDMVPDDSDLPHIMECAKQIFELSQGRNEVRFDRQGRPSIMVNFFNSREARLDYLSGGGSYFSDSEYGAENSSYAYNIHPAFIVDGNPVNVRRIGKYLDIRYDGKNYHQSLPGFDPACGTGGVTMSYSGLASACDAINSGIKREDGDAVENMTIADYGYLGLLSVRKGFCARGNDSQGLSGQVTSEHGVPAAGYSNYRYYNKFVLTKTGSGPDSWRHDGSPFGVSDVRGNTGCLVHGFQMLEGRLLYVPNNDLCSKASASGLASELAETSSAYKALKSDGTWLEQTTTEESMFYDYKEDMTDVTSGSHAFEIATSLTHQQTSSDPYGGISLSSLAARDGVTIPLYMRLMLNAPLLTGNPTGYAYMRNAASMRRVSFRGGIWSYGVGGAGFGSSNGYNWGFGAWSNDYGGGRVASYC